MKDFMKICIITIPDRERYVSNAEFADFVDQLTPVFEKQFPDIEFLFLSGGLNIVTTGLDELELLLFEIKNAIDELKEMRDASMQTLTEDDE